MTPRTTQRAGHDVRCLLERNHEGRCWVLNYEYHQAGRTVVAVPVPSTWHKPMQEKPTP